MPNKKRSWECVILTRVLNLLPCCIVWLRIRVSDLMQPDSWLNCEVECKHKVKLAGLDPTSKKPGLTSDLALFLSNLVICLMLLVADAASAIGGYCINVFRGQYYYIFAWRCHKFAPHGPRSCRT